MNKAVKKPKIICVVGPTASGKTGLAIEIAKRFSGEIISADSRQVYRGLDIGTAKVTEDEMDGVPHHLLDVVDVNTVYSADDFKRDGTKALEEITNRENLPIIAGGTFFYVDILLGKTKPPAVAPDLALREELEALSTEDLFEKLKVADPRRAKSIDRENKRRLIRALEVVNVLGEVPELPQSESPYDVLTIGITTEKDFLRERFGKRADQWMDGSLEAEVRGLLDDGVTRERLQEIGFEYQLILSYIDGVMDQKELRQRFIEKNWQYARRQIMWLKRDETIQWFENHYKEVFKVVKEFLKN